MLPQCTLAIPEELQLTGTYISVNGYLDKIVLPDSHERAWAAGFFDGEGCTYVSRPKTNMQISACVDQIHPDVVYRFQAAVTGVGKIWLRPAKPEKSQKPLWNFTTRRWQHTQIALALLWPYLGSIKKQQAARMFTIYQQEAIRRPRLGQPTARELWTATTCPQGHTDIYVRMDSSGKWISRRCRTCRKEGTQHSYRDKLA